MPYTTVTCRIIRGRCCYLIRKGIPLYQRLVQAIMSLRQPKFSGKSSVRALLVCLLAAVTVESASAGTVDFEFTATPDTGGLFSIPDDGFAFFPLTMAPGLELTGTPGLTYPLEIASLELEITGLSHSNLEDLTIVLLDPFTNSVAILDEMGGMNAFNGTLIFNDDGVNLPTAPGAIDPAGSPYLPAGGKFGDVPFDNGATDAWALFIIDDSEGNVGTFSAWTLRGAVVPEPATLALFALGGVALARRRRKHG